MLSSQSINQLSQLISKEDNNVINYNLYYGHDSADYKQELIHHSIHQITQDYYASFEQLNDWYLKHQHFCWESHAHHFHTDFIDYIRCPVTCLYEIVEFLNKIEKELSDDEYTMRIFDQKLIDLKASQATENKEVRE